MKQTQLLVVKGRSRLALPRLCVTLCSAAAFGLCFDKQLAWITPTGFRPTGRGGSPETGEEESSALSFDRVSNELGRLGRLARFEPITVEAIEEDFAAIQAQTEQLMKTLHEMETIPNIDQHEKLAKLEAIQLLQQEEQEQLEAFVDLQRRVLTEQEAVQERHAEQLETIMQLQASSIKDLTAVLKELEGVGAAGRDLQNHKLDAFIQQQTHNQLILQHRYDSLLASQDEVREAQAGQQAKQQEQIKGILQQETLKQMQLRDSLQQALTMQDKRSTDIETFTKDSLRRMGTQHATLMQNLLMLYHQEAKQTVSLQSQVKKMQADLQLQDLRQSELKKSQTMKVGFFSRLFGAKEKHETV